MGFLLKLSLLGFSTSSQAAIDVQQFEQESQRERYQTLIQELRCPKCKNQNLAGTNSSIAIDLRRELREMILAGKTDSEILEFMVTRYGDFVLYRPRVQSNTYVLWYGPGALFVIGLVVIGAILRKRSQSSDSAALSADEEERLQGLMSKDQSENNARSK